MWHELGKSGSLSLSVSQSGHWVILYALNLNRSINEPNLSNNWLGKLRNMVRDSNIFTSLSLNFGDPKRISNTFLLSTVPIVVYDNIDKQKDNIIQNNRGKSGVYRWVNKENNKSYIGSSVNLVDRFFDYFNLKQLMQGAEKNSRISRALIKYGYSGFNLEILEYCAKSDTIKREQFYMDLLKPEYNILQKAGSLLGYKHSTEALEKIRNAALRRKVSEDTRIKMGQARLSIKRTFSPQALENLRQLATKMNKKRGFNVEVTDISTTKAVTYKSANEAAKAIGCSKSTILSRVNFPYKLIKGKYLIKVINS